MSDLDLETEVLTAYTVEVNNFGKVEKKSEISMIELSCKRANKGKKTIMIIPRILIIIYIIYLIIRNIILSKEIQRVKVENQNNIKEYYSYQKKMNKFLGLTYLDFKEEIAQKFFEDLSKITQKKITYIKTLHLSSKVRFGNSLLALNNGMYYCEIVGCENIIVEPGNWYITQPIYIKDKNFTILPYKKIDCSEEGVACVNSEMFYFYKYKFFLPTLNFKLLSNEIYRNIPEIKTNSSDLYIHLRSEDIFAKNNIHKSYAQPPLCFYQKIIESNSFKNIIIFSNGKENPVIQKLIDLYPDKVIFKFGNIKDDIGELAHAKNLVLSTSSFIIGIARISKYAENVWMYDMLNQRERDNWIIDKDIAEDRKFTEYIMIPSKNYLDNIYPWNADKNQLELMLNEKCENDFIKKLPL